MRSGKLLGMAGGIALIGVMFWETSGFVVEQYLARNYAEEPAILDLFISACRSRKLLLTFNGKSFENGWMCLVQSR